MKKTHEQYLHKGIVYAINFRASDTIQQSLSRIRSGNVVIYGLIRDIVSDVRFYSVTELDRFWLKYSFHHIRNFINSICAPHWNDDHVLTGKKEDFLNKWFADHLFFLTEEEKKKKLKDIEEGPAILSTEERDNKGKAGDNTKKVGKRKCLR